MEFDEIRAVRQDPAGLTVLKFVVTPLPAYLLGRAAGLNPVALHTCVILAASPTAIQSVVVPFIDRMPAGKLVGALPQTLFILNHTGEMGLGFDLSRPAFIQPGYAYAGGPVDLRGREAPANDGLYRFDFTTMQAKLIVSFAELADRFGDAGARRHPLLLARAVYVVEDLPLGPDLL
jgi:hypothetical protein